MVKEFLVKKMIWKGLRRGVQAGIGFMVSRLTKSYGIEVTPEQEAAIVIAVTGALESGINTLKQRFPGLSWL